MKHKLYKAHYPIKTEEEKEIFLTQHRDTVLDFLEKELLSLDIMHFNIFDNYTARQKNPIGILGRVKWKSVAKNKVLAQRFDRDYCDIERRKADCSTLRTTIINNTSSVNDVNTILVKMNNQFSSSIFDVGFRVVFVLILVAICKFTL